MSSPIPLERVFAALGDPTRLGILEHLRHGSASVHELAAPFAQSQPTISNHLRVLEEAGLIETSKDGTRRPRKLVLGGPMREVEQWLKPFRAQWDKRLDRLEGFLDATKEEKDHD